MITLYKPGQKAPISGLYEILNPQGQFTGKIRPVDKGHTFPPTLKDARYILKQEVRSRYTEVASKAVIDETTSTFAVAIDHLAKL